MVSAEEAGPQDLSGHWHDWSGGALIEPLGRGALYADGFFTTCKLRAGRIEYEDLHLARMIKSAEALKLNLQGGFDEDLRKLAQNLGSGVLKVYVQRLLQNQNEAPSAAKRRGYAPSTSQTHLAWQFFQHSGPMSDELICVHPAVSAVLLSQKISLAQDNLAGLKTLARLDQVLAAAELSQHRQYLAQPDLEGVTLDLADQLCEGVSHNLCLLVEGRWVTPELKQSGIHGVFRAALLKHGLVHSCVLTLDDLKRAKGAVLINSVRGLIPLKSINVSGSLIALDGGSGGHLAELIRQNTSFMSDILC